MKWLPVVGMEGRYEVSDEGNVRSLDRVTKTKRGHRNYRGKLLRPGAMPSGHLHVVMEGKYDRTVHTLVLEAFVGPAPEGMQACHHDDNPTNNRLDNLSWGTKSQNSYDAIRNGRHFQVQKTHCNSGHPLSGANLRTNTRGFRECITCARARRRRWTKNQRG